MTKIRRRHRPYLHPAPAAAVIVLLVLAAFAAGPAAAAKRCGEKVIDDWYADGRVDGTYPPHCYDDAIESVPPDVRDYSSAVEDIQRALQARLRGQDPPPASSDPTPNTPTTTGRTTTTKTEPTRTDTTGGPTKPGNPNGPEASPPVDDASADSVPIPLLVLAGLALLLIAAGSAGYVTRRLQARRLPPPGA